MKRRIFLIINITVFVLFVNIFVSSLKAQVTIGSQEAPNSNALLDMKEDDTTDESQKGFLLPRVVLVGPNVPFPLLSHVEGMIVYNTAASDSLPTGLYKNDGVRWQPMEIPAGESEGQFLVVDPNTMIPRWVTKYIPPANETEAYSLTKAEAFKYTTGVSIPANENWGGTVYTENSPLTPANTTGWHPIIPSITIPVNNPDNKIIIFLQTTLLQPHYASGNFLSYAGGIFLKTPSSSNSLLKGVRMSLITSTGGGTEPVSKAETLFFVLENLPVGNNVIQIAFKRRTPSNQNIVTALNVGRNMTVGSKTYQGSTSLSYEYYERN